MELCLFVPTPERARRVWVSSVVKEMKKYRIRRLSLEQVLQILRSRTVYAIFGVVEATTRRIQPVVKRLVIFLLNVYI